MEQVKDLKVSTLKVYRRHRLMELDPDDGAPIYLHRLSCPKNCDSTCNGERGWEIAHRIVEVLGT